MLIAEFKKFISGNIDFFNNMIPASKTDFAKYSHTSTTGENNTITADIDTEETRISIGYNF